MYFLSVRISISRISFPEQVGSFHNFNDDLETCKRNIRGLGHEKSFESCLPSLFSFSKNLRLSGFSLAETASFVRQLLGRLETAIKTVVISLPTNISFTKLRPGWYVAIINDYTHI